MTSLGLVGIADKGTYSAEATYNKGQFVLHDGSTWLALKDNLNGVTPAEGENWKYLARGFAAELLSLVTAIDSQGLSGSQGGQVTAQSLIDVLADKVANQLIAKSMMSNVQVNDSGKVPTSALAYAMQQSIETLNSKIEKHTFGTIVTLVNNTDYTTQSDGYFTCYIRSIGAGANKYVSMIVNREESFRLMVQEKDYIKQSIFVKKGMTIKYTLGSAMPEGTIASFIPFV